jgi:hypothetical protein
MKVCIDPVQFLKIPWPYSSSRAMGYVVRLPWAIRLQKVPSENQVGTAFYGMKSFMGIIVG